MTSGNADRLVFDRDLLGKGQGVLDSAPHQPAVDAVAALAVQPAAFGAVPGAAEAAGRVQAWVDHGKTEMARVTADVADLGRRTGMARELIDQLDQDSQKIARSVHPRP